MSNLRKEYKIAVDAIRKQKKASIIASLRAATPKDTGEAAGGWAEDDGAIVNPVAHIVELNAGSSEQAGSRFIEKAILSEDGVSPNGIIVKNV